MAGEARTDDRRMIRRIAGRFKLLLEMIKFSHTLFALPFALTGMLFAAGGMPRVEVLLWILAAMVGARTAAMTVNRIADAAIDAKNPRTAMRHLPAGTVGFAEAWLLTLAGSALTVFAAWKLNPLCLALSPVALGAVFLYPFLKRFTLFCHIFLGICLSAAPLGAYMAVTGRLDPAILPLALAVVLWVAGFDILYALQDLEFDSSEGLHSIPRRLGVGKSLLLAKLMHGAAYGLFALQVVLFKLGVYYWAGLAIVFALLVYEHSLVKKDDLSRLDAAFFTMNGIISVVVFAATALDYWAR